MLTKSNFDGTCKFRTVIVALVMTWLLAHASGASSSPLGTVSAKGPSFGVKSFVGGGGIRSDIAMIRALRAKIGGWWPVKPVAVWHGNQLVSITRGDPNCMEVALTFDDGPHPPFTQKLLALLHSMHVPATFFVVGWKVDEAPDILKMMLKDGDDVANHTYHHFDLKLVPPPLVHNEIDLNNDAIERACGVAPRFFRPSGGQYDPAVINAAANLHMVTVLWTNDPADYVNPGSQVILDRVLPHVRPGAIILLHDGIQQTYDILPEMIDTLRSEGYKFVTLTQMAARLELEHDAPKITR